MSENPSVPTWGVGRERLAYSIRDLAQLTSISRAKLYEEIAAGRLRTTHVGRRTIVLRDEAERWLRSHG